MLETVAWLLVLAAFGAVLLYLRELGDIVAHARQNGLEIRNICYSDLLHIYSDVGFLNWLFAGSAIGGIKDDGLRLRLTMARRLLITQVVLGLAAFATFAAAAIRPL